MTRIIVRLVLAASVLLTMFGAAIAAAPGAHACDIIDPFPLTAEHFADDDFNAPTSQLNQDYQEWVRDENATISITGVYVYESIYTVESDDEWYAGSVSVPMEIWGEWPEDMRPEVIEQRRRDERDTNGGCGLGPTGRSVGARIYSVVGADNVTVQVEDAEAVFSAAFGSPDTAPRDANVENDLIAQIGANRRSTTQIFIGGGLAAVAIAGIIMYMSRPDPE